MPVASDGCIILFTRLASFKIGSCGKDVSLILRASRRRFHRRTDEVIKKKKKTVRRSKLRKTAGAPQTNIPSPCPGRGAAIARSLKSQSPAIRQIFTSSPDAAGLRSSLCLSSEGARLLKEFLEDDSRGSKAPILKQSTGCGLLVRIEILVRLAGLVCERKWRRVLMMPGISACLPVSHFEAFLQNANTGVHTCLPEVKEGSLQDAVEA